MAKKRNLKLIKEKAESYNLDTDLIHLLISLKLLSPEFSEPADYIILDFCRKVARRKEYVRLLLRKFSKKVRQDLAEGTEMSALEHYVYLRYKDAEGKPLPVMQIAADCMQKFRARRSNWLIRTIKSIRRKVQNRRHYVKRIIEKYNPPNDLSEDEEF